MTNYTIETDIDVLNSSETNFNPLSPKTDRQQISPHHILAL